MQKDKIVFLLLFLIVFTVGFAIRIARFPDLPPGFNQDEANSATETYSLIKTGKDKWGNPYPAYFPSWGSGQSVLMAYLSIPVVKVFGLSIFSARLVPVVLGILTLPLFFLCLLPFGRYAALLGMLILSVVPWHFMMSRWALECNLLPFFMLLGCGTLSYALVTQKKKWILLSLIPFALSLYCYGTTIIVLSLFLVIVVSMHYKLFVQELKAWLMSLALFILMAFPFTLFFLENYILKRNLTWTDSLFFSTPICPANRLDQTSTGSWKMIQSNMEFLISGCNDHTDYNMLSNFSVLLPCIILLSLMALICGVYSLYKNKMKNDSATITLSIFIAWLCSSSGVS
jgi:predicted membrane-bound mannosyltransferase